MSLHSIIDQDDYFAVILCTVVVCSVAEDLGSTLLVKLRPIASDALKKTGYLANMYHRPEL